MLRCVPRVLVVLIAVVLAFGAVASAQNDAEPRTLVPGPPKPAPSPVTLNAYNALVKANQVVLSGSTTGAVSVEAAGPAGVVTAPVVNGQFTITAPLLPDRLNRVFVTGIASNGVRGAPATANVTRDNQAPDLHVDFPGDGELIQTQFSPADPRIDVGGRVADLLSGYRFLAVSINGQPAEVDVGIGTNGTFFLPDVLIQRDATTVIAVNARDALGNAVATQISVTHATLPPADNQMARISGNAQTGPVNQVLPQPLVARVFRKNPAGQGILPFFGKQVTFEVARSNGTLSTSPTGPWTQSVQVESDSFGDARVYWKLGGDAGCGNQRVKARSLGILGTVGFCASASPAGALQLNIGTGNNQMAEVGATLPEPLRAWVSDGCNGVVGVPVTFTVTEGNGRILDQTVFTTFTTQTGHAFANFEVGSVGNNRIEVNFPGNPNDPAVFVATGVSRDQPSTSFVGIVLNNAELPIEGAEVWLTIPNYASAPVLTDCNGVFRIENLPSGGPGFLHVEGATAYHVGGCNGAGVNVLAGSFPALHFEVVVTPQTRNSLPRPALLPPLNPANARSYSTTQDTVLTVEEITGLQMVIKAGSMTLPNGLPAPDGTLVSLNKVNHDKVPMPMPDGAAPPFAWTLQPGGSTFNPPIQITYPNMSGLPPGAITNFLSYNHDTERFEIVASGAVDSQGFSITTDPGSGLSLAGWGCNCPPYWFPGSCQNCSTDCVSQGTISSGTISPSQTLFCVGSPATFTCSGATDSGGGKQENCPDGSGSSSAISPSSVQLRWEATDPGTGVQSGTGAVATITPSAAGSLTVRFYGIVQRECAPSETLVATYTGVAADSANPTFTAAGHASVMTTAPSATAQALLGSAWGMVWPEDLLYSIDATCSNGQWQAVLTDIVGKYSLQARLLPGVAQVTGIGGNTTSTNFCDQVNGLLLGIVGTAAGWYMIEAVQAHEQVHASRFLPALIDVSAQVESLFEAVTIPHQQGMSPPQAVTALQASPAYAAAQAISFQLWQTRFFQLIANDHGTPQAPGGPTQQAEEGVVLPVRAAICAHAATVNWPTCAACPP